MWIAGGWLCGGGTWLFFFAFWEDEVWCSFEREGGCEVVRLDARGRDVIKLLYTRRVSISRVTCCYLFACFSYSMINKTVRLREVYFSKLLPFINSSPIK